MALELLEAEVYEGSAAVASVVLTDAAGSPVIPTSAEYRIDCVTSGTEVRDWTSLTPDAEIEIDILPIENAILDDENDEETKQITIRVNAGLSSASVEYARWLVRGVPFLDD